MKINKDEVFSFPIIINSDYSDTARKYVFDEKYLSKSYPEFVGKYRFSSDTIDISFLSPDQAIEEADARMGQRDIAIGDSFDLVVNYEQDVYYLDIPDSRFYLYYPVYFVNSTDTDKIFFSVGISPYGMLEAQENGEWQTWSAVNFRGGDMCTSGHAGLIVRPKEFIVILMKKYVGDYETNMRVRFKVGASIYVSKPFRGQMNESQFMAEEGSWLYKDVEAANENYLHYSLYGAHFKTEKKD